MTDADYKETLDGIRAELEGLLDEELKLELRLREVRERSEALGKAAQGLAGLVGEEEEESIGITDAIRETLKRDSDRVWTPRNVRIRLKMEKFPIEKYQNPLAVIHTTLKRLEVQGEVTLTKKDGKTYYKWDEPTGITDDYIPF